MNLVFNAIDALPQGGIITLVSRSVTRPVAKNGNGIAEEEQIQVEVRDNGVGMDEGTRERCLEPFFSTKAKRGGTGLGLAMVYGMMQRHHGAIEINSSPGHGTAIRLTFPIRDENLASKPGASPTSEKNRSLRILCIDDEPQVQELLKDCFTMLKHDVTVATGGKEGVEMFRQANRRNQPFEVVITDLGMPDLDGRQVARAIRKESGSTPIVMMTGWGTMMSDDGETPPEVDALVGKPPRMKDLNSLLIRLAGQDRRSPAQTPFAAKNGHPVDLAN